MKKRTREQIARQTRERRKSLKRLPDDPTLEEIWGPGGLTEQIRAERSEPTEPHEMRVLFKPCRLNLESDG